MIPALALPQQITKAEMYHLVKRQAAALLEGETDFIANSANISALLFASMPAVNWVGFYYFKHGELVLGPFQGNTACVRIPLGKGVCGTAAANRISLIVPDVHAFEGHIACDSASNSEIVVPMIHNDSLIGVLDIDSPEFDRFEDTDRIELEYIVSIVLQHSQV